jgi:hypothetical protein
MSSRSLRGTRLGSLSMETDEGIQPAPRQDVTYVCDNGHRTVLPFSLEADVPAVWECRCGLSALRENGELPEMKPGKPVRTHWDMLCERREMDDLEALLKERVTLYREGRLHVGRPI